MSVADKPALGVVGTGKVGQTLARVWKQAGYHIAAVYNRTSSKAEVLANQTGAICVTSPLDVITQSNLVLLTVPDDAIADVVSKLVAANWAGKGIVHVSGAHDLTVLHMLKAQGAMIGSLHPAFPFADVETAIASLPGAAFALESSDVDLSNWLHGLVQAIDGQMIVIPPGGKAIYHAALVMASNYVVTLYSIAEHLLTGIGANRDVADVALNQLVQATVNNLKQQESAQALTGPLTRADIGTIQVHMRALHDAGEIEVVNLYRQLARMTYPLLKARQVDVDSIEQVLKQDETNAFDDP